MHKQHQRQRKAAYFNELNEQIEQQRKKRQFESIMTEHERLVNDKEIKAYEQMDSNSYSLLPGFRSNLDNPKPAHPYVTGNSAVAAPAAGPSGSPPLLRKVTPARQAKIALQKSQLSDIGANMFKDYSVD